MLARRYYREYIESMATTIENLKTAIVGESTACAMYASFASKALQEGYPLIAKLFEA